MIVTENNNMCKMLNSSFAVMFCHDMVTRVKTGTIEIEHN